MTNAVRLLGKVLPAVVFGVLFLGTDAINADTD